MFMYKYLQNVLTTLCFTFQLRDLFSAHTPLVRYPFLVTLLCSHFSSQKHIVHFSLQWNALPYIGKFACQATLGIYGLAATCGHNNITAALRLRPIYGYGQSMVMVYLQLQPIYGYGQSTVAVNLRLRPLYFVTMASLPIPVTVLLYLDHMHYQSATLVQQFIFSEIARHSL